MTIVKWSFIFALISIVNFNLISTFYVPGVAPQDFNADDTVEVKVSLKY